MAMLLEVANIDAGYGHTQVLRDVSLTLDQGSFSLLIGRNGMGKTTLLRSIMGLTPASRGQIVFDGQRIEALPPHAIYSTGIGYVPQGRHVFPFLTVRENLRMGLRRKSQKRSPILDEVFALFPVLGERAKQKAGTLSGGEQQMLAIGRALAGEVKLLLLDEPTEGVAPNIVDEIFAKLTAIHRDSGLTILMVEQDIEAAFACAGDFFVMQKGSLCDQGSCEGADTDYLTSTYLSV